MAGTCYNHFFFGFVCNVDCRYIGTLILICNKYKIEDVYKYFKYFVFYSTQYSIFYFFVSDKAHVFFASNLYFAVS